MSTLQPQIAQYRETLLKCSQNQEQLVEVDSDFTDWILHHYDTEAITNFASFLNDRFGEGEWRYHMFTSESPLRVLPFFKDIEALVEDMDASYDLLDSIESSYDIAAIYDMVDYIVELSDGGLGVYYK